MPGKTRHSCTSIILCALKAGGLENYLADFKEKVFIADEMTAMVKRTAQHHNKEPNKKDLEQVKSIPALCGVLGVFGYGNKPIADWFGTAPRILKEMIQHAIKQKNNPRKESRCVVM